METRPTLYVMVGLPAAGKTTRAREIESEKAALRLTPDEWMIPLFGATQPDGKRDVLEGRFVSLALRALSVGVSVVLDFGVWSKDERSALRSLAGDVGADCQLVYLDVTEAEQRRRVDDRMRSEPSSTFEMDSDDLDGYRVQFEIPDDDELSDGSIDPPPTDFATWAAWAAKRWPSFAS
jgi:predicted kinase